ncbi:AAA family ATPase [Vibrio sp. 1180_3]|uniref:AAA family ATPase n=1 Tax=Vibrio sp. 1180_3 TaxID=2528832 RepID=UPI0024073F3A|nr:AAA family ATPase [Vibrio sp. 1180_3]MDF9399164.1 hypothetical protein [Vibrio sp. 1180_3]
MSQKPTRFKDEIDGIELEYVLASSTIAKLFHMEDKAKEIPYLNTAIPHRIYLLPGTDEVFKHPLVPKIDEMYEFDLLEIVHVLPYILKGIGSVPYFYGMHGTGKSSTVDQLHARLGLPVVRIILGEDSEVIDLGGQMLPTETGGMRFHDGLLVQAMRNGWTILIDEYDLLPTRQQKMLNEVMDNRRFTIEITGEQVTAHDKWRCCLTANTNNTGTGSSSFVSSGSGDASVNDRFQMLEKHYLAPEKEKKLLTEYAVLQVKKHPQIKGSLTEPQIVQAYSTVVDVMLTVAMRIRKAHEQSMKSQASMATLECTISTRSLKRWIAKVIAMNEFFLGATGSLQREILRDAFKISFVNGISADEKDDVLQIFDDSMSV